MRILVADKLAQAGVDVLSSEHDVDVKTGLSKDELLAVVAEYDAIVVRSATTLDKDIIRAAKNCKVIARAGVGLDNVAIDAATDAGVMVVNAPTSNTVSAAEHTIAMLMAAARNIPQAHQALVAGRWERSDWKGTEVDGKTLSILGLGRIGTLVAERAKAFGMRLVAYDPFVTTARAEQLGVELVGTVSEALEVADFITLHLPKTDETAGMLDAAMLANCKPTAVLINVARGGIIDEAALAQAIEAGQLGGAAIDVFATEPTTQSPLFGLPSVIATPHLGASTDEAQDRAGVQAAESVLQALRGDYVPAAVNVSAKPVPKEVAPFVDLGDLLGRVVAGLSTGTPLKGPVDISYLGHLAENETGLVGMAALRGLLSATSEEPVTFVNAPKLAEGRGLSLRETRDARADDFAARLELCATLEDDTEVCAAGVVFQPGNHVRIVAINDVDVDVDPTEHLVVFAYSDQPGVIGTIGTELGKADINIANAHVGRSSAGGDAIMVLALDGAPTAGVVDAIAEMIGATSGRYLHLD